MDDTLKKQIEEVFERYSYENSNFVDVMAFCNFQQSIATGDLVIPQQFEGVELINSLLTMALKKLSIEQRHTPNSCFGRKGYT